MPQPSSSKLAAALKLEFDNKNDLWLSNGYTLRKLIGVLGMALPLLLWLYVRIDSGLHAPLPSISHYYYTRASSLFTIIVSLLAIFLIVYKGKDPVDFYTSAIAGVFALCVLLFPTDNLCARCCDADKNYCVTYLADSNLSSARVLFHYTSAGIFLLCLAFMSLFIFTRSKRPVQSRGQRKKTRNSIYKICGIVMIAALVVIFAGGALHLIPKTVYDRYQLTFWMEAVAVEAFGFSWLVKGEAILVKEKRQTRF